MAVDTTTPLDVVCEDADFVAVNKPVGFHTAPIHRWQGGSMVSILLAHFARTAAAAAAASGGGGGGRDSSVPAAGGAGSSTEQQQQQLRHVAAAKPYVMHRLDFNTSGLLLFGKQREVVPGVAAQFRCAHSCWLVQGPEAQELHWLTFLCCRCQTHIHTPLFPCVPPTAAGSGR
jgi:23S rRNA-/tRNA-specific pseudouridylate synthase